MFNAQINKINFLILAMHSQYFQKILPLYSHKNILASLTAPPRNPHNCLAPAATLLLPAPIWLGAICPIQQIPWVKLPGQMDRDEEWGAENQGGHWQWTIAKGGPVEEESWL